MDEMEISEWVEVQKGAKNGSRETWVWGQAARKENAARLWEISEQMTQV